MWTTDIPSWLSALKLPGKVIFGLFLFCVALLALSHFGIVPLKNGPWVSCEMMLMMMPVAQE
jgi:hypothetical protein